MISIIINDDGQQVRMESSDVRLDVDPTGTGHLRATVTTTHHNQQAHTTISANEQEQIMTNLDGRAHVTKDGDVHTLDLPEQAELALQDWMHRHRGEIQKVLAPYGINVNVMCLPEFSMLCPGCGDIG